MRKIFLVLLLSILLVGCGSGSDTLEYSHGLNFIIAVDNPDEENVDHVEAGTYTFDVTNNKTGEAPMYDIYITNEYHNSISELENPAYTIGGVDAKATDIKLESGQYVYIISCELAYEPKGHLIVKKAS